jgi:hypothetical protein
MSKDTHPPLTLYFTRFVVKPARVRPPSGGAKSKPTLIHTAKRKPMSPVVRKKDVLQLSGLLAGDVKQS